MRRVEHLVRAIRRQSDNEIQSVDEGINDSEILQYLNDGQEDLAQELMKTDLGVFVETYEQSIVASQEEYDPPPLTFGEMGITRVDYAYNGFPDDYRPLRKVQNIEERTYTGTASWQYTLRRDKIMINPVPEVGINRGLRFWYRKKLPVLDFRRSQVEAITIASDQITVLDLDELYADWDVDDWIEDDKLCIVGVDGTVKAYDVAYDSVAANGNVTLTSGLTHTIVEGETPAIGDFVCRGQYSSTHSELADFCEKFLIEHAVWRIKHKDESQSWQTESMILQQMRENIISMYAEIQGDVDQIPAIDYDFSEYL